jgi:GT2 family glycosyltransferase
MCSSRDELVSVVILNYNNKELLRKSVGRVLEINWPGLEVIVVDNASSDGAPEMVEAEFGNRVHLIRRTQNSPTEGRNQGFAVAKGRYILSLDNDIIVTDKNVVAEALSIFDRFPTAALLAFKIGTVENPIEPLPAHWWHPVPIEEGKDRLFWTDFFPEGAVLFRAEAIKKVGGYDEVLFQYCEQQDLAFRFTREGYDMLYCPTLTCGELPFQGNIGRKRAKVNYLSLRNKIWMAWKHYPFTRAVPHVAGRVMVSAVRSMRQGWVMSYIRAVRDGLFAPASIRSQRRVLGKSVWQKIQRIHKGKYGIVEPRSTVSAIVPTRSEYMSADCVTLEKPV